MARTKKEPTEGPFADPANPTLHELNSYAQRIAASPVVLEAPGFSLQENGNLTLTNATITGAATGQNDKPATE